MAQGKTKSPPITKGYEGAETKSLAPSAGEITQWMRTCETGLLPIATDWLQNKLFSKGLQYLASAGDHTIMLAPVPQNAKRITVNVFSDKRLRPAHANTCCAGTGARTNSRASSITWRATLSIAAVAGGTSTGIRPQAKRKKSLSHPM
jgi:hypothetical protein